MEKMQTRLEAIEAQLGDEAIYSEANKAKLAELVKEQGGLKGELDAVEEEWLTLQEQLEASS
jgi:ATP-binding cassette subfamily F protein 3